MPTDSELLDFERRHERHTGTKELLIVDELGLRPARYYQLLRRVVRTREAWASDPMLCRRVLDRQAA